MIPTCIIFVLLSSVCMTQAQSVDKTKADELLKCFANNHLPSSDAQSVSSKMTRSRLDFSVSLMKTMVKYNQYQEPNVFFSPYSIYQALLLAYFIAANHTEDSIKLSLQLPRDVTKLDIVQVFKMESEFEKLRVKNDSVKYQLNLASRLFVQESLTVRQCMRQLFTEEIQPVNYQQNAQAVRALINNWVSNVTNNQINDLLQSNDVSEASKLILVNAIYFKGMWQSKFLSTDTKKEVFYITPSKNALVPMMRQKGNFKYLISERLGAHVIQLPYRGEDVSMFILLPPFVEANGIEFLLKKLTSDVIMELVEPGYMIERPVELAVPKFTVEKTVSLIPILEAMGVGDLFRKTSDLSSLTDSPIEFSGAVHKSKIMVDEEGTTAAAATALFQFRSSRPLDSIKFVCNHPFLYFLFDNVGQTILFSGIYNSPL